MIRRLFTLAVMTSIGVATPVSAQQIEAIEVGARNGGAELRVRSRGATAMPRVDVGEGVVRVHFTGLAESAWLDADGDGRVIQTVRARPGIRGTTILTARLVPAVSIDAADVVVRQADGDWVIAFDPPLPGVARDATTPTAAPASPAVSASPAAAPSPESTRSTNAAASALPLRAAPRTPPMAEGGSPLDSWRWLAVVMLLGGVGSIAMWLRRRTPAIGAPVPPSLDVIASKRLGPRSQLVIVRALERDVVLHIGPNGVRKLLQVRSPRATAADEGRPSFLRSKVADATGSVRIPPNPAPNFGSDLARILGSAPPSEPPVSEGIANVLRLRSREGA